MRLGRRRERQEALWVACHEMPQSPGNPFYEKLNTILDKHGFDAFVENLGHPDQQTETVRRRYYRELMVSTPFPPPRHHAGAGLLLPSFRDNMK